MNTRLIEIIAALLLIAGAVGYVDYKNSLHEAVVLDQVKQQNALSVQLVQQLQQQNTQLAQQILTIQQQAQQQKVQVVQLPPQQLAQQTQAAIGTAPGSVTVSATDPTTEIVTQPAAQEIMRELIQGKADAQTVINLKAELDNDQKELVAKDAIIKNDQVEIKALKGELGRAKRKWFVIGFISGFFVRVATHA